jgi:transcriptional regulator with XRE-family HTH domain
MSQDFTPTDLDPADDADWGTAASGAAASIEPMGPAEGSDAAASIEFGRNLARVRESRNLDYYQLAALTTQFGEKGRVSADSIKEYERGDYRPKQPKLWGLAQALDVMPIVLGPGSTRGGEPPVPVEQLLCKKPGRAVRLQKLVELLTEDGRVSTFAALVDMQATDVYAVAASEVKLNEEQLEPFLTALPRVRRSWLMSGEGEPLAPVQIAHPAPVAAPVADPAPVTAPPVPAAPGTQERLPDVFYPAHQAHPLATPSVQPLSLAVPVVAGAPLYVPLGLGLVAEVDAVLLGGAGAVSGFRLLAGAGVVPALTSPDQLERLFHALRGVLDQRAGQ